MHFRLLFNRLPEAMQTRVHMFNSFFFQKLCAGPPIFRKDFKIQPKEVFNRTQGGGKVRSPFPCNCLERLLCHVHIYIPTYIRGLPRACPPPSLPQMHPFIDVFGRDFIIVPICDGGHWTLAIIINPPSTAYPRPPTLLLHLDSIKGCHNSNQVFQGLRAYLQAEWASKADPDPQTTDMGVGSVPWIWEKQLKHQRPDFSSRYLLQIGN